LGEGKTAQATPTPSIFSTASLECGPPPSSVLLEIFWPPRQPQTLPCLGEETASQRANPTPLTFSYLAASPAPSSTLLAAANPVPQVSSALRHPPCRPFPAPAAASVPHVPATPLPALPAPTIQIPARVPCPLVAHAAQALTILAASQPQTARCVQQAPSIPSPAPTRRRRALGVAWARTTRRLEPIRPQLVCRALQASTETNLL